MLKQNKEKDTLNLFVIIVRIQSISFCMSGTYLYKWGILRAIFTPEVLGSVFVKHMAA